MLRPTLLLRPGLPLRPTLLFRMNRIAVDRCRVLSCWLAICLIASQLLTLDHHVHHGPVGTAAWGEAPWGEALLPADADAVATADSAAVPAALPGRPDTTGHAPGDATCLALAHLLLSGPPGAGFDTATPASLVSAAAGPFDERLTQGRPWHPALPRGPPAVAAHLDQADFAAG